MFWRKKIFPAVTFATTVWEKDWRFILENPDYLSTKMIENHLYPFSMRLLVINNVDDVNYIKKIACRLIDQDILTHFVVASEIVDEMLNFFELTRSDFRGDDGKPSDWVYYNALGPLAAIYTCQSEYLLYHTGDVRLEKPVDWIEKAVRMMEKNPQMKVANLLWNENLKEVKKESYQKKRGFYFAKNGFSDQQFLIRTSDFQKPIYGKIHSESSHYPRGEVFERRVYSHMRECGWERLISAQGSYIHENF